MTTSLSVLLVVLALLVGAAAAVRSTWSPCGLSMLSTLTPFGERAKGHRFAGTAAWFIAGAALGGLALGALAAGLAALVTAAGAGDAVVVALGCGAALVALMSDTGLARYRVPAHYRQVNERWLDAYRPWVYGGGFGVQIGCGLATYITTAAVYLTVVLAGLSGRPLAALGVGLVFGLVRGAAVTLTRRTTTPSELLAFHQRFAALLPRAERGVVASIVVAVAALAVAGPLPALLAAGAVAVGTAVLRLTWRLRHRGAGAAASVAENASSGLRVVAGAPSGGERPTDRSVAVG